MNTPITTIRICKPCVIAEPPKVLASVLVQHGRLLSVVNHSRIRGGTYMWDPYEGLVAEG